jgi:hypothetical protein
MSYPINYPTPQGANIQIFNARDPNSSGFLSWTKPQGASFVWFTLIGGGGGGDNSSTGGGSGAVTNFMCPAFLIPDFLEIVVGAGGAAAANGQPSQVYYVNQGGSTYYSLLLTANGGTTGGAGGTAMTSNYFSCMGFFQSVAGQAGTTGTQSASTTTFLSGGGVSGVTSNYGYDNTGTNKSGYFLTQPIIVGVSGNGNAAGCNGGIGCGGGTGGKGGNGLVVIITW